MQFVVPNLKINDSAVFIPPIISFQRNRKVQPTKEFTKKVQKGSTLASEIKIMLSELARERKTKIDSLNISQVCKRGRGGSESKNFNLTSNKDFDLQVIDHIHPDPDQDFFQCVDEVLVTMKDL